MTLEEKKILIEQMIKNEELIIAGHTKDVTVGIVVGSEEIDPEVKLNSDCVQVTLNNTLILDDRDLYNLEGE